MEIDFGSRQVRVLLAVSAIWCAISLSLALDDAKTCTGGGFGFDLGPLRCSTDPSSFVAALLAYTSPVWAFWLAAWVFRWRLSLANPSRKRPQPADESSTMLFEEERPRVRKFMTWPAAGFLLGFGAPIAGVTLEAPGDVGLLILVSAATGAIVAIGGSIVALIRRRERERRPTWTIYVAAAATIILKLLSPTTGLALVPAALFVWAVKTPRSA